MIVPQVNYLAVLVAGLVIFMLGGLWYSPALFSKRWIALQGRTEEQMKADAARANMPLMYLGAFICGLVIAWMLAAFMWRMGRQSWMIGAHVGALAWLGFVAPTSFLTGMFSMKPKQLWLIDSLYYLVAFALAGAIIGAWK
jgi:surface polysaccharide O-acyltransferase-like enzyme